MKLIMGLGNPGPDYLNTRHNLGSRLVKAAAKKYKVKLKLNRSLKSRIAKIEVMGDLCLLVIPATFMNLSGEALKELLKLKNTSLKDLLVIYDDMDLELGALRFRKKGSWAGHKGISSIIKTAHTEEFNRLKVGIGRPAQSIEASDYVLSNFSKTETKVLASLIKKAVSAVEFWIKLGIDKAMNEFN